MTMEPGCVGESSMNSEPLFENRNCFCNKKAAVFISESKKNPNKFFIKCKEGNCSFFARVQPISAERKAIERVTPQEESNDAVLLELVDLKERMARFEEESDWYRCEVNDIKPRLARLEEIHDCPSMKTEDDMMKQRLSRLEGAFVVMMLMLAFFYVVRG